MSRRVRRRWARRTGWEALMREFFAAVAISAIIIGVMLGVG
jgi:hypothetical protein